LFFDDTPTMALSKCELNSLIAVGFAAYLAFLGAGWGMSIRLTQDGSDFGFMCYATTECSRAQTAGSSWTLDQYAYALGSTGTFVFPALVVWTFIVKSVGICTSNSGEKDAGAHHGHTLVWYLNLSTVFLYAAYALVFLLIGAAAINVVFHNQNNADVALDKSNDATLNYDIKAAFGFGLFQIFLLGFFYFGYVMYEFNIFRKHGNQKLEQTRQADKEEFGKMLLRAMGKGTEG
jgi:hypothetical protein